MGVNKPDWAFLLQEINEGLIDLEDGNGLQDKHGNGAILLEQQSIGCSPSPLLASISLAFIIGTIENLSEVI